MHGVFSCDGLRVLAVVVGACTALHAHAAAPNHDADVRALFAGFDDGSVTPNQLVNKLVLFDAQKAGTAQLVLRLRRTSDERRRGRMLQVLSSIAVLSDDALSVSLAALGDEALGNRMAAAKTLGRLKSVNAVSALEGLLRDKATGARREAARALGALAQTRSGAALMAATQVEDEPETRALMLVAIGSVGDRAQTPALEPFLGASSESTRFAAAHALMRLGAASGEAFVKRALASADSLERLQGVQVLEGVSSPLLNRMVNDPNDEVRATAARMLAQAGDARRIEWLVVESEKRKAEPNAQVFYEREIEKLRVSHETRDGILKKAGLR